MNDPLQSLLQFLSKEVNDACRDDVDVRVLRALNWEPVDPPPLVVTYPFPEDAPFRPYPHREIFDDPVKMLYNELVCAFDTSIALHARVGDDLPLTVRANFGHLADAYLELPSIRSLDFGQSEMNDVETIYAKAAAKRIALIRVAVSEEELVSGRAREQFPTGAVLIHRAESFESARRVARSYRESCKSER